MMDTSSLMNLKAGDDYKTVSDARYIGYQNYISNLKPTLDDAKENPLAGIIKNKDIFQKA